MQKIFNRKKHKKIKVIFIFLLVISVFYNNTLSYSVFAQSSTEELKQKIEDHSGKIQQLDNEIKKYEKDIEKVSGEAQSLQNTIKILDINQKKIGAQISKTQSSINQTNTTIGELQNQISLIEKNVDVNKEAVMEIIRSINQSSSQSIVENILSSKSLSLVLDEYNSSMQLQEKIRERTTLLSNLKIALGEKKASTEAEKNKLLGLKSQLNDENQILFSNKKDKNNLLNQTKNKESEYKKILAEKQLQKAQFERDLFSFESALKLKIDPDSYVGAKKGILSYPLDKIIITQAFGRTVDAKKLYTSGSHNGVDFGVSRGTPVKAALSGIVEGTGNTDTQKTCYSYGKWVLIKHPNGLSTLYAHLDLIKVAKGDSVDTGSLIGYSGATGYATGPHLHFTLYVSQGVRVEQYTTSKNCKNVAIPIADPSAYLDPMLYF